MATSGQKFKKFFLWHQAVHIMYLNVDRQACVIKTVAYSLRTDRHTDTQTETWTDKSLKTEGPKILSNDIFYFSTVIIGGPTTALLTEHLLSCDLVTAITTECTDGTNPFPIRLHYILANLGPI